MSDFIKALISQIVVTARRRGLTQAQLAERAGVTAVGLSKAKHRGDIRASTLQALAEQLDLELSLSPRHSREKAIQAIKSGSFFRVSAPPEDKD
jgi:transcriptional regulator with XRE-family HTH domain